MARETIPTLHLQQILCTEYQNRSQLEHQIILDLLLEAFPNRFTAGQAKLLSLFLREPQPDQQEHQIATHSLLIKRLSNSTQFIGQQLIQRSRLSDQDCDLIMVVDGFDALKCEALGWHTPEEEIKFFQSWPILSQIPRKRLYQILKHCSVARYRYGQTVHKQGDAMRNGYYLVRWGQFCFSLGGKGLKDAKLLSFKEGYIFQHRAPRLDEEEYQQFLVDQELENHFDYTLKCHTSHGVVYCIDKTFFDTQLLKFCQQQLTAHLANQASYLKQKSAHLKNQPISSLPQHKKRPLSQQLTPLTAPTISSARSKPILHVETKIFDLFEKPTNYRVVKESLPRRDRLFSKKELKKLCPDAEEDESEALIWKKAKCERLKELRPKVRPPSRVEILFAFTQSTINFQKHRRKPSVL